MSLFYVSHWFAYWLLAFVICLACERGEIVSVRELCSTLRRDYGEIECEKFNHYRRLRMCSKVGMIEDLARSQRWSNEEKFVVFGTTILDWINLRKICSEFKFLCLNSHFISKIKNFCHCLKKKIQFQIVFFRVLFFFHHSYIFSSERGGNLMNICCQRVFARLVKTLNGRSSSAFSHFNWPGEWSFFWKRRNRREEIILIKHLVHITFLVISVKRATRANEISLGKIRNFWNVWNVDVGDIKVTSQKVANFFVTNLVLQSFCWRFTSTKYFSRDSTM